MYPTLPPGRAVMVGYGKLLLHQLDRFLPPRSVVVVEDPDIVRKRDVHADVAKLPCVDAVIEAPYHRGDAYVGPVEEYLAGAPVSFVIPGLEYGVLGAATLAHRWKLPGAGVTAAEALTDKLRLRAAAQAAGLRGPEWTEVFGPADVAAFAAGGPVVLKPANRHASLGVQLLEPGDDLHAAWALTVDAQDHLMLPDTPLPWRYLAERRLHGREYSVEALVRGGEVLFSNVTGKLTAGGRHPVELGHVVPADLPAADRDGLTAALAALVAAIGYDTGVLHAEFMVDQAGPTLVECAGRIPGDSIVFLIDAAYGGELIRHLVALLAGSPPALTPRAAMASAIRFLAADTPGVVRDVAGVADAAARPGVLRAAVTVAPGDHVNALRSSWDRIGEVMTIGTTPAEAAQRADQAATAIRVHVEDVAP
ncbi:MAG TPA: ATP-grasp domain-containing protein [Pilimelia sp.]|nr:ATP-grasp domain-containing protein [Pilimelia sp.]